MAPATEQILRKNKQQIWKIYFKIFSQQQVKLFPVTLLQSTDQTSVLGCINAMTKIEYEEQLTHKQIILYSAHLIAFLQSYL